MSDWYILLRVRTPCEVYWYMNVYGRRVRCTVAKRSALVIHAPWQWNVLVFSGDRYRISLSLSLSLSLFVFRCDIELSSPVSSSDVFTTNEVSDSFPPAQSFSPPHSMFLAIPRPQCQFVQEDGKRCGIKTTNQ